MNAPKNERTKNYANFSSIRLLLFSLLIQNGKTSLSQLISLLPRSEAASSVDFYDLVRSAAQYKRWEFYNGDLKGNYLAAPHLAKAMREEFERLFRSKSLSINQMDSEEDFMETFKIDEYNEDIVLQEAWPMIEKTAILLGL